ncbi:MAG: hypothetical protein HY908_19195 [Myxococcales bacterium]|nr:hypothetical protein [Myxococcales bacterium]
MTSIELPPASSSRTLAAYDIARHEALGQVGNPEGQAGPSPLGSNVAIVDVARLRTMSETREALLRQALADLTHASHEPRHRLLRGTVYRRLGEREGLLKALAEFGALVACGVPRLVAEGHYQLALTHALLGNASRAAGDLRTAAELGHAEATALLAAQVPEGPF